MTGPQLKRRRTAARLTQSQLAALLGVTANSVARWERGEIPISTAMARLIDLTIPQQQQQAQRRRK